MNKSWLYIVPICVLLGCKHVLAIDCYVCSSLQHGNRDCEDKFDQNLKTSVFIARSCDFGFFKATHCIKLKGTREYRQTLTLAAYRRWYWSAIPRREYAF
ncbi:uncharacterized protein LOC110451202 isoform X3 [Mizuhopecten yessoensis]|uniref:uncharacterized protein LOC110451202 isoform X3 n=1 Tax=Mizuhopecten yessoensis TaxID=6573 RepID=UPI000B459198|nr:uncharacterized protein LOC110451202 isoform X3 [Mizuhopecten yessoensis]